MTIPNTTSERARQRTAAITSLSVAEIYASRRAARNDSASLALGGICPTPTSSAQKLAEAQAYLNDTAAIYESRRNAIGKQQWK